jgi:hypothetical protein
MQQHDQPLGIIDSRQHIQVGNVDVCASQRCCCATDHHPGIAAVLTQ